MRHQVDLVRRSDGVVAQTKAERDFYAGRGVDPARVHVVGAGFNPDDIAGGDAARFRARHHLGHPIVYMLTKMSYDKGVTHTIEAMRQLWDAGSDAHLVLAGDVLDTFDAYYATLPDAVKDRISLLGMISDEEKRDLLAAGDVLAMPSRTDSFGIVYLEAWAYGKPVVGARTWGVMDVIDAGQDGLLVPFGDVEALSRAFAQAMGRLGREKAFGRHTWAHKYPQIRDLYLQLASHSS